jgi:hypothetical protein
MLDYENMRWKSEQSYDVYQWLADPPGPEVFEEV